jgi:hypothetical protein
MKTPLSLFLGLFLLLALICLTGCPKDRPTPKEVSELVPVTTNHSTYVTAKVDPVGPPRWTFTVETFSDQRTNSMAYMNLPAPTPGSPNGHTPGAPFTNVTLSASNCVITVVSPGWTASGTSISTTNLFEHWMQFTVECEAATNGAVYLDIKLKSGWNERIGPIQGPQR